MRVMKTLSIASVAALAIVITSCGPTVYVQTDETTHLAKDRTYMWVDTKSNQNDTKNVTAFAQKQVRTAVNEELAKEGWREVSSNPDILVSYDILVQRTRQQQSNPVYSQPFTRMYYNPYRGRWGTIYYPSQFIGWDEYSVPVKEGTLTITMTDSQTDKPIWQAWTTETLNYNKLTASEAERSIRSIFKKFDAEVNK